MARVESASGWSLAAQGAEKPSALRTSSAYSSGSELLWGESARRRPGFDYFGARASGGPRCPRTSASVMLLMWLTEVGDQLLSGTDRSATTQEVLDAGEDHAARGFGGPWP